MKGIVFALLTLILGAVIGIGIEKLASLLPLQLAQVFTREFSHIGVHPFSINLTIAGIIGLVAGYLIVDKFVRK